MVKRLTIGLFVTLLTIWCSLVNADESPVHSYTRSFELDLDVGVNMIAMPLNVNRIQKDGSWMAISESAGTMAGGLKLQDGEVFRMLGNMPTIPISTDAEVEPYFSSPAADSPPTEQLNVSEMVIVDIHRADSIFNTIGASIFGTYAYDPVNDQLIPVTFNPDDNTSIEVPETPSISVAELDPPFANRLVNGTLFLDANNGQSVLYDPNDTDSDISRPNNESGINIYQGTQDYVVNGKITRFFAHERGQNTLVPVKPVWLEREGESLTASQLAESVNTSWVIQLDQSDGRFKAYIPEASTAEMDFSLESGRGYLVNVTDAKMVNLEGMPWGIPIFEEDSSPINSNEDLPLSDELAEDESPQPLAAPSVQEAVPWAFVVSGHIAGMITEQTEIVVTNLRTGVSAPSTVSVGKSTMTNISQSSYTAVFVDPDRKPLVNSADVYQVTIIDPRIDPIQHQFWVESNHLSVAHLTANIQLSAQVPQTTQLGQNYPNPFNPETWIPFQLHQPADVSVTIYDVVGTMVREISVGFRSAGSYQSIGRAVYWDGRTDYGEMVASGVYFYALQAGDFTANRRLVILK